MSNGQLFTRNGRYYHRNWIPLDLRQMYGDRVELVKSLKTPDKRQAVGVAAGLQQKYSVTFTLLRSGLLSRDVVQSLVAGSLPKPKAQPPPALRKRPPST
jgi:hypothetical protein